MKPGIYPNMPDAEYRAIKALSNSDLVKWAEGGDSSIDPKVAALGSAFHAAILEPDVAREKIIPLEPKQQWKSHPLAGSDEAWVLTRSNYDMLVRMVESVKQHPELSQLREMAIANRDRCEVVLVWDDPDTGILCKAKVDQYTDRAIYDWKSTNSDPDSFGDSIGKYMYHMQAAHYLAGAAACGLPSEVFRFVCASKRADKGHVCWLQDISTPMLTAGQRTFNMLKTLYAQYGQEPSNENQ